MKTAVCVLRHSEPISPPQEGDALVLLKTRSRHYTVYGTTVAPSCRSQHRVLHSMYCVSTHMCKCIVSIAPPLRQGYVHSRNSGKIPCHIPLSQRVCLVMRFLVLLFMHISQNRLRVWPTEQTGPRALRANNVYGNHERDTGERWDLNKVVTKFLFARGKCQQDERRY